MMYYYWTKKGIRPSVFYEMPKGELMVVQAFYEQEITDKNEMIRQSEGKAVCPLWLL